MHALVYYLKFKKWGIPIHLYALFCVPMEYMRNYPVQSPKWETLREAAGAPLQLINTSMKPSLLSLKHLGLALNSLDTLFDVRIKAFMLLF